MADFWPTVSHFDCFWQTFGCFWLILIWESDGNSVPDSFRNPALEFSNTDGGIFLADLVDF